MGASQEHIKLCSGKERGVFDLTLRYLDGGCWNPCNASPISTYACNYLLIYIKIGNILMPKQNGQSRAQLPSSKFRCI